MGERSQRWLSSNIPSKLRSSSICGQWIDSKGLQPDAKVEAGEPFHVAEEEDFVFYISNFHLTWGATFEEGSESREIAIRHVDDFLADVYAVVTIDLADLVCGNDIGTMDAQELVSWQHLLYSLHGQVGDQRLGLVVEIKHHVVLDTADVGNLVDHHAAPLAIDADKDGVDIVYS